MVSNKWIKPARRSMALFLPIMGAAQAASTLQERNLEPKFSQGEGTVMNGSGVQTTTNSRWSDYASMNIDPVDDCTFWYVNEYYTEAGQASSAAGWQTRIASFKLPGCN